MQTESKSNPKQVGGIKYIKPSPISKLAQIKTLIPNFQTQSANAVGITNVLPVATKAAKLEKATKWSIWPKHRNRKLTNPQLKVHHNQNLPLPNREVATRSEPPWQIPANIYKYISTWIEGKVKGYEKYPYFCRNHWTLGLKGIPACLLGERKWVREMDLASIFDLAHKDRSLGWGVGGLWGGEV